MKRLTAVFLSLFLPAIAANATTVEFDLTGVYYPKKNKESKINVRSLNRELKKKGIDGLPEEVVVTENAQPYGKLLLKRIEAAQKAMGFDYRFVIDNGYYYEYPKMCYRGKISDVPDILKAMEGTFLNNEQGVLAIRYKRHKIINVDYFKSAEKLKKNYEGSGQTEYENWLDFDESSDDVLVMSDLGPQGDGTELYSTLIKPCK